MEFVSYHNKETKEIVHSSLDHEFNGMSKGEIKECLKGNGYVFRFFFTEDNMEEKAYKYEMNIQKRNRNIQWV